MYELQERGLRAMSLLTSNVLPHAPVETAPVPSDPFFFALQVSSTETPLKDHEFGYDLQASRTYQARTAVSPLGAVSQYPADMSPGDVMDYRQGSYAYGNKGYYGAWSNTYPDENAEYPVNYPPYQMMGQDPVHMMQGYGRYGSSKVYVDPEPPAYSYANLVHRPAASSDSPNISLSGMADALPNSSTSRVVPSDRLLPQVTGAMTSTSYRTDGLPGPAPRYSKSTTSHATSSNTIGADAYGALNPSYESPTSYSSASGLPSSISHRSASHSDSTSYQAGASGATDAIYGASDHSLHQADDSSTSLSYIYDRDSTRRDTQSSSGASTLSNGQVYVPGTRHHTQSAHGYVVSGSSAASQGTAVVEGATTAGTRSGHGGSSRLHAESHRRSAGSLRGGG